MNFGPYDPFVTGLLGLIVSFAVLELGVLALRVGARAAAGESPDQ